MVPSHPPTNPPNPPLGGPEMKPSHLRSLSPWQYAMAKDLEAFVQGYASVTTGASAHTVASFVLDMAEKHHGASGVSVEAIGAGVIWGAHLGVNIEVFHNPGGTYSIGVYGFETVSAALDNGLVPFTTNVIGLGAGIAGSLNVARSAEPTANVPERWIGFSNTLSVSAGFPGIPLGAGLSVFWSPDFIGAEISSGFGTPSAAWSNPFFHLLIPFDRVDRETVLAIYSLLFQRIL